MYSMSFGAISLGFINIYGFLLSTIIQPVSSALLITSLLVIVLVSYIELNKRRVLLTTCVKESFLMFGLVILFQLYYIIIALTELIFLNTVEHHVQIRELRLDPFTAGLTSLPIHRV